MKDTVHVSVIFLALLLPAALIPACAANGIPASGPARMEAALSAAVAGTDAVLARDDAALSLRYPSRLVFGADGVELLPAGRQWLDQLARVLAAYRRSQIVVTVYTDAIGSAEFNRQQAQLRAAAVVAYLGTKGIAAARMVTRAGGEGAPLAPDNTPEGRDQNRRLEMTITPLPS